jgi:hypothetical protein
VKKKAEQYSMRVIIGDECGLLKEVVPSSISYAHADDAPSATKVQCITPLEQQSRARGIISLAKLQSSSFLNYNAHHDDTCDDGNDDEGNNNSRPADLKFAFAALLRDGSVETYQGHGSSVSNNKSPKQDDAALSPPPSFLKFRKCQVLKDLFVKDNANNGNKTVPLSSKVIAPVQPIGLGCCSTNGGGDGSETLMAICSTRGDVSVAKLDNKSSVFNVLEQYDGATISNYENQTFGKRSISRHPPCTMTAFGLNAATMQCAVAGRNKETVVMDLTTGKVVWKAKNVRGNSQTLLAEPVWGTSLEFLPSSPSANTNLLAVGTAYKQVRIYDLRMSPQRRRPIIMTPIDPNKGMRDGESGMVPFRVTSLCTLGGSFLGAGDAAGFAYSLDMRRMDRIVGRYRGPSGAVRSMSASLESNTVDDAGDNGGPSKHKGTVAMVGLDRYMRTYNVSNRKELDKVYLKQRVNCCLAFDEPRPYNSDMDDGFSSDEDNEYDETRPGTGFTGDLDDEDRVDDINVKGQTTNEDGMEESDEVVTDGSSEEDSDGEDTNEDSDDDESIQKEKLPSKKKSGTNQLKRRRT